MESVDVKCCLKNPIVQKTINLESVSSASDLRALFSVYFEIEPYSFDMVYLGIHIKDNQLLSEIGFKEKSVIYIFNSSKKVLPQEALIDIGTFNGAVGTLKKILTSKVARNILAKKLQNQKLLECIMKAVPEFGRDPIAISIVTSKDLLWLFLSKPAPLKEKVLAEHPSMARAIMFLVEALKNENLDKLSSQILKAETHDARAMYSIDHMSDDDDDDEGNEDEDGSNQPGRERSRRHQHRDPPAGFPRLFPQQPGPNDNQPSTSAQSLITTDFFRHAMMMATGINNTPQTTPGQSQSPMQTSTAETSQGQGTGLEDIESKVKQLREMGIMDEDLARRILMETGGSLELAIEILFGM